MSDEGVSSPAPLSTQRKAQRAVPFVIASGLMSVVMNLAGLFLLVRYLAPEEYGVWVLLTGLSPLVGLFTSFGFEQSLMRYMPVRPEGQPRSELFWAIMLRRLAFVGFASLVLVATFPWFAERFGLAGHFSEFLLVQPAIVLLTSTGYASIGLNIAFRQREAFIAALVQQLSYLAGVAFGIATRQPLVYFVVVNSVSAVALFVVSMGYCIRSFGAPSLRLLLRPLAEDDRERRYRRASYVNAAADNLLSSDVTRYLLAAFSTTSEVATYALAGSLVGRLGGFQPVDMFRSLVTVSILERFERGRHIEDLNQGFGFLYAANHLLTVYYVALFLPLGAEALTWVFREEYVSAYLPALFLFLSISLFGMPVGLLANVLERPQALIYSKVAILVNVFLGVPLAIRYGASGMAFAGMISAFVKNAVTYGLLRREFELRFPWSGVARFVLAGATGSAASWLAKGWMPLPAAVAVGSAAYFLGTRAFGVLNSWDRRVLVSMFPDRLQPVARLLVGT